MKELTFSFLQKAVADGYRFNLSSKCVTDVIHKIYSEFEQGHIRPESVNHHQVAVFYLDRNEF